MVKREIKKRINENIKAQLIRLIESDGTQTGVVSLAIGLAKAKKAGLDLVEISKDSNPPVCRIIDFSKLEFEKKKKKQKKTPKSDSIKEIKIRPKIEEHDYQFKKRHAEEFLKNNYKLKISLVFRGRELQFKDLGIKVFQRLQQDLAKFGEPQEEIQIKGRINSVILNPISKQK